MKLIIIGASGHGKVVADIAAQNGYTDIVFLDDNESVRECGGHPVIGRTGDADSIAGELFVAIGNPVDRRRLMEQYKDREMPVLIHPDAVLSKSVTIQKGSVVMAGVVINPDVKIGEGCIINTCSSIDHDCVISDYVHIAVGAHLCGMDVVESMTWIGAGATVSNNIRICGSCMIGAGAVVVKDIETPGTYIGLPARMTTKGWGTINW